MGFEEALIIAVGSAIAKSILKIWFKEYRIASDVSITLVDIIKTKVSSVMTQQATKRQFEEIGQRVGRELTIYFKKEAPEMDDGSRTAVALAVANTLNTVPLTSDIIMRTDLDPAILSNHLKSHSTDILPTFSEPEEQFFLRTIDLTCRYIVDISSSLPGFTQSAFTELLRRQSYLLSISEQVIEELRLIREYLDQGDSSKEQDYYRAKYRRIIVQKLNQIELFGLNAPERSRRQILDVAFVDLLALEGPITDTSMVGDRESSRKMILSSVTEVLSLKNRLLITGVAGSGKTTLLKWIAVRSALGDFSGDLSDWNEKIPIFLRLRKYSDGNFPYDSTELISTVAPELREEMPKGWIEGFLRIGKAIVLIDGIDELSRRKHAKVREWLENFLEMYPEAVFILSSRTHAVQDIIWSTWFSNRQFHLTELQSLTLSSIVKFIANWHASVASELTLSSEQDNLEDLRIKLTKAVRRNIALRNVAKTPLLCAMICALHRERRAHLPSDRIELYRNCVEMLLERRDTERDIALDDYPLLSYRQKLPFLTDLAYWLLRNGWTEISSQQAIDRISRKLKRVRYLRSKAEADQIYRFFIDRSGILVEPAESVVTFTHKSIQEFLAAQAIINEDDIDVLIRNAIEPDWRETIILAVGVGSNKQRNDVLRGIIARGEKDDFRSNQLYLLAMSTLEVVPDLNPELEKLIDDKLENLIPPRSISEAESLSSVGDLALPFLAGHTNKEEHITAACVRAIVSIGGVLALEYLEDYADDWRPQVDDELIRGLDHFEQYEYMKKILSKGEYLDLTLATASLDGIQFLTHLQNLDLRHFGEDLADLELLHELKHLKGLILDGHNITDDIIGTLINLPRLSRLSLKGAIINSSRNQGEFPCLEEIDLSFSDLTGSAVSLFLCDSLRKISLSGTDISGAELTDLDMSDVDFTGAIMSGTTLTGSRIIQSTFDSAALTDANFEESDLSDSTFRGADLTGADFTGAILVNADFSQANLRGVIMSEAIIAGALFHESDIDDDFEPPNEDFLIQWWDYMFTYWRGNLP